MALDRRLQQIAGRRGRHNRRRPTARRSQAPIPRSEDIAAALSPPRPSQRAIRRRIPRIVFLGLMSVAPARWRPIARPVKYAAVSVSERRGAAPGTPTSRSVIVCPRSSTMRTAEPCRRSSTPPRASRAVRTRPCGIRRRNQRARPRSHTAPIQPARRRTSVIAPHATAAGRAAPVSEATRDRTRRARKCANSSEAIARMASTARRHTRTPPIQMSSEDDGTPMTALATRCANNERSRRRACAPFRALFDGRRSAASRWA